VAAVAAAIDLQSGWHASTTYSTRNNDWICIGLHLGEVIVDETQTIFGDAVNVLPVSNSWPSREGLRYSRDCDATHLQLDYARRWRQASRQEHRPFSPGLSCTHAREPSGP
jgi:hypothetical protein